MLSATDIIAIYGAVVATAVLIWDIIKWRMAGRFKLVGQIVTGMVIHSRALVHQGGHEGGRLTAIEVTNRGDVPCEVTHFCLLSYQNLSMS